jgi:hypothetical protein
MIVIAIINIIETKFTNANYSVLLSTQLVLIDDNIVFKN